MTRDEAKVINREFYRYCGGVSNRPMPDGRTMARVVIDKYPAYYGLGIAADPVVATAYAWRNLKRKVFYPQYDESVVH